jgi:hypothetical protein
MVAARGVRRSAVEKAMVSAALVEPPPAYLKTYARLHPLAYAALAGLAGAQTMILTKAVCESMPVVAWHL